MEAFASCLQRPLSPPRSKLGVRPVLAAVRLFPFRSSQRHPSQGRVATSIDAARRPYRACEGACVFHDETTTIPPCTRTPGIMIDTPIFFIHHGE